MSLKFSENYDCIIRYVAAPGETEISIPEGVRMLLPHAFRNSTELVSIHLPSTVHEIDGEVFKCCDKLRTFTLPDNSVFIAEDAFARCGIQELTIPADFSALLPDATNHSKPLPELPVDKAHHHIPTKWDALYDVEELDEYFYEREIREDEWWEVENEGYYNAVCGMPSKYGCDVWPCHPAPYKGLGFISSIERLEEMLVSEENEIYATFDGALYDKSLQYLLAVPAGKKSLRIPASCKTLKLAFHADNFYYSDYDEDEFYYDDRRNYTASRHDKLGSHALTEIQVDSDNRHFASYDGALFSKDLSRLIAVPKKKESIIFPPEVRQIEKYAFFNAEMEEVFLPAEVDFIGESAFPEYIRIHFLCADRTISITLPDESWPKNDGNWMILEIIRAQTAETCFAMFQTLEETWQKLLIIDMCERWTDYKPFHDFLVSVGGRLTKEFVRANDSLQLERLLNLNGISREIASVWLDKANQLKYYECQIQLMRFLASGEKLPVEELTSWLSLG